MSFFAASWARMKLHLVGPSWDFWLTVFPLTFFAIFLSIPAVRAVARRIGDVGRNRRNEQRRAVKRVLDANGGPLPLEPTLSNLALPLEGEPDVDASGNGIIKFPRVAEEREALKKYLAQVDTDAEARVGKVIFGSDEEPPQLKS
jgi:hypothetical protein